MQREVTNWDTEFLESQIVDMIRKTKFVGQIAVTFPVTHSRVEVKSASPASASKSSQSALKSYMTLSSLSLSSPLPVKDYSFVKVDWPYATTPPGHNQDAKLTRQYAVESERAWWEKWCAAIRNCVLAKRSGWVTMEDRIEVVMGLDRAVVGPNEAWGVVSSI